MDDNSDVMDDEMENMRVTWPMFDRNMLFREMALQLETPKLYPPPKNKYREMHKKAKLFGERARVCKRRKDLLHLLLSYPMKTEADEADLFQLRDNFIKLDGMMEKLPAIMSKKMPYNTMGDELVEEIPLVLEDAERCLAKYDYDINLFCACTRWLGRRVPAAEGFGLTDSAPPETQYKRAVDSAIHQVLHCFKGGVFKVIGICGCKEGIEKKALEDLPEIRSMFEVVISISVSNRDTISEVRNAIAKQIHQLVGTDIHLPLDEALKPYKFVLFLHCCSFIRKDLRNLKIPEHGLLVLTAPTRNFYQITPVDLEIRMEDHLLPWKLFWENLSNFSSTTMIKQMAMQLIEACSSHLLAIILLARALKYANHDDLGVWELALQELQLPSKLSSPVEGMSEVMIRVLKFVWERKNIVTRHSIKYYCNILVTKKDTELIRVSSLVDCWIENGLIETEEEAKDIVKDLIDSFLLEIKAGEGVQTPGETSDIPVLDLSFSSDNFVNSTHCVQMRVETRDVLLSQFIPQLHPLYLEKAGLGLSEAPEVAEWDAKEINLNNNQLSELPEKPSCPSLVKLFLQKNCDLMVIPSSFFVCMPKLQVLDLSHTSIKSLPPSISMLLSLQEFLLRDCELLMELPPEIGALLNLKVLDLEGTEIMYLPYEIQMLTELECLKVSLYGYGNTDRESKQTQKRIPVGLLSRLCSLKQLSIDVNPDDEEWIADVEDVIHDLQELTGLVSLKLYLPKVGLLVGLDYLPNFKLTVGHHKERIIPCLPHSIEEELEKHGNYLKYINGESIPAEIQTALHFTDVFYLERHWTVKKLSEFGGENMVKLKFCCLVECNELETIIDGGGDQFSAGEHYCKSGDVDREPVLKALEYLRIHCMMNLRSIWEGPIGKGSLSKLKFLALHECPNLTTVFTRSLLGNLYNLEELILEDCPKINSLVNQESSCFVSNQFLPNLKKLSLLDLPELVSISNGFCIAPKLERIIIYACPMLETLFPMEWFWDNLKVIKGEVEWWNSLSWHEGSSKQQAYMASIFVELKRDASLMDELAAECGNLM